MSKRFKSQEYFRYPGLGTRWRRPRGLQSKLRIKKGGSGMKVDIGYGSAYKQQPVLIRNVKDFEKDCKAGVLIASGVGCKKVIALAAKAKELGLTVVNMKKAKKALRFVAAMKKRKEEVKKKKHDDKAEHETKTEHDHSAEHKHEAKTEAKDDVKDGSKREKKLGFHESVVPQVMKGKTKTYRLRDHELKVGDGVVFENSRSGKIFGHGKIRGVEHTTINKINLKDPDHGATYDKIDELISAFKRHYPEREVTPETKVFIYTYNFAPKKETV
ncbi:MAG: eL32 family ribosomal protein [Candidatus Aenigmatarchaeota archaeon]